MQPELQTTSESKAGVLIAATKSVVGTTKSVHSHDAQKIAKLRMEKRQLIQQVEKMQSLCEELLRRQEARAKHRHEYAAAKRGLAHESRNNYAVTECVIDTANYACNEDSEEDCELVVNKMLQTIIQQRLALFDLREGLEGASASIAYALRALSECAESGGTKEIAEKLGKGRLAAENALLRAEVHELQARLLTSTVAECRSSETPSRNESY